MNAPPEELARHADPATSREATEGLTDAGRTERQRWVYRVLRDHGPCTDEALCAHYGNAIARRQVGQQTESSIRTRRHELVTAGWVVLEGKGRTATGRSAQTWRALAAAARNDDQQARAEERRAAAALAGEEPETLAPFEPPPATRSAIFGWEDD